MTQQILVSDVGSTTTKLLLLELDGGEFRALGTQAVGTTVEKPTEDVCVGFRKGLALLAEKTGVQLVDSQGNLTVPFHTTSSAGGGLQILVIALASGDSGAMANAVTYSSGGVVLDSFCIDDEMPRVEKIRRMKHLSPDLVVMAGGYEDGAIAGVVNMAQLVALSNPKPKYGGGKLPLVFCGNTKARPFIQGMLKDMFSISFAENIRPDGLRFNLGSAIQEVHRLFMDHVMQMAPGYADLSALTTSSILPTPAGVERILGQYTEELDGAVVLADMGGATTDIFSNVRGQFQRTVAANTGMSYSLSNIVREAGDENVFRHIPWIDRESARNWILSKTLFPTSLPGCTAAADVEGAAAAEGMRLAWRHHLSISYRRSRVGCTERLRRLGKCKFDEAFRTVHGDPFKISDIAVIIGAGGIMAHSSPRRAAWILTSGFRPRGLTLLMVDRHFQSPHMGVISRIHPEAALNYYKKECLAPVARVYSPIRKMRSLKVKTPQGDRTVKSGGYLYLESSEGVSIPGVILPEGNLPLVIDLRFADEILPMDFLDHSEKSSVSVALPSVQVSPPEEMEIKRSFSLSYAGEIKVKQGETVEPGTLLGENRLIPPRVFFVDVRNSVGYDRQDVSQEDIMQRISVVPGDRVSTGQEVFSYKTGKGITGYTFSVTSPVRGKVTSVTPPGLIILREIQDYDGKPHHVNVARLLGVKPSRIGAFMKVSRGEFVQREQVIAVGEKLKNVKSPATGTVLSIDRKTGIVLIQYVLEPVSLYSPMSGVISGIEPDLSVDLLTKGMMVQGMAGFGPVRYGNLVAGEPAKDSILLLREALSTDMISRAVEVGAAGIIAPAISGTDLVDLLGEEPGVILTGDEDLPLSLIILKGMGTTELESRVFEAMSAHEGSNCVIFTTTRLRAGVERPFVLIQSRE